MLRDWETLQLERHGALARVMLNRPELHNAFNETMIAELTMIFGMLGEDPAVRVIVLGGHGKSFCAGADLNWMSGMMGYSREENRADAERLAHMLVTLADCPKPLIGRIHGAAFGGGVGLASVCDLTVALADASFCLSEVKLGLIPAVISPFVLRKMPISQANRYFLTAERFSAEEALRMGLVSQVVTTLDALDEAITAWVRQLSANGPDALAESKRLIRDIQATGGRDMALRLATQRIADRRVSAEGQEGMRAFLDKRPPSWTLEPPDHA